MMHSSHYTEDTLLWLFTRVATLGQTLFDGVTP